MKPYWQAILALVFTLFPLVSLWSDDAIGVIEVGAKGIKKIRCDATSTQFLQSEGAVFNADFASSWDGKKFDEQTLENSLNGIGSFVEALEKGGIPKSRVFVILSSGTQQVLKEKSNGDGQNGEKGQAEAISAFVNELSKKGVPAANVSKLSVEDEAELNYSAAVTGDGKAIALDIGSGNSKVTIGEGISPYKKDGSWRVGLGTKALVAQNESDLTLNVDRLVAHSSQHFLSGGIAYVLASWARPEEFGPTRTNSLYIDITTADIAAFRKEIRAAGLNASAVLFNKLIGKYESGAKANTLVFQNLVNAKSIFEDAKHLDNGSWLLSTIYTAIEKKTADKPLTIRIVRDGQYAVAFGWAKIKGTELFGPRLGALVPNKLDDVKAAIRALDTRIEIMDKNLSNELKDIKDNSRKSAEEQIRLLKQILEVLQRKTTSYVPPSDRKTALVHLSEALLLHRRGQLEAAIGEVDKALIHSVVESDIWAVRAIITKELGDMTSSAVAVEEAAKLLDSGKFSRTTLARMLTTLQGRARIDVENELLFARAALENERRVKKTQAN